MGKAAKFLYLLSGRLVPLLDEYSGAAAAYSLRSLTASSTTNVVKVRRSGDDAELDFTADKVSDGTLAAWVVAGGGTEDGFVKTWYDQSGNTNNATQATAANQPKIVSSGTLVTENGKAALDFDGTNDRFATVTTGTLGINTAAGVSAFSVAKPDSTSPMFISSGGENRFEMHFVSSVFAFIYNTVGTNVSISLTQLSVTGIYNSSGVSTAYANGQASATPGNPSLDSSNVVYYIGARIGQYYMNGTIQELILYPSDQSANRTGIEANINAHYNIY